MCLSEDCHSGQQQRGLLPINIEMATALLYIVKNLLGYRAFEALAAEEHGQRTTVG